MEAFAVTTCRIIIGNTFGTGILISENLVLTCGSLFDDHKLGRPIEDCVLRFGIQTDNLGALLETQSYDLDLVEPIAAVGCFDETEGFVVLRVNGAPGADKIQSKQFSEPTRGWISILPNAKFSVGDGTYVLHQSKEGSLQVSFMNQSITDIGTGYISFQNDTAPGSLGAPIVTTDWHVVAIHAGVNSNGTQCGLTIKSIVDELDRQDKLHLISTKFGGLEYSAIQRRRD